MKKFRNLVAFFCFASCLSCIEGVSAQTIVQTDETEQLEYFVQDSWKFDDKWSFNIGVRNRIDLSGGVAFQFGPSINIGNTYGGFDNDWTVPGGSVVYRPDFDVHGLIPVVGVGGGWGSGTENLGNSNQVGTIAQIDGLNFIGPITMSQNRNLDVDIFNFFGQLGLQGQFNNGIDVYAGFLGSHSSYDYSLTELASGGGPFFTHNLNFDLDSGFVGTKVGIGKSWSSKGANFSASIWAAPGFNRLRVDANQSGTIFGGAVQNVSDVERRFAVRAGVNLDLTKVLSNSALIGIGAFATVDTAAPNIEFPVGGSGNQIQARSETGYNVGGYISLTIPLGTRIQDNTPSGGNYTFSRFN